MYKMIEHKTFWDHKDNMYFEGLFWDEKTRKHLYASETTKFKKFKIYDKHRYQKSRKKVRVDLKTYYRIKNLLDHEIKVHGKKREDK